tara:strand:+ start:4387 stop:6645 length:2259 start_codon:yes stop_codon:yes gene_type:complete
MAVNKYILDVQAKGTGKTRKALGGVNKSVQGMTKGFAGSVAKLVGFGGAMAVVGKSITAYGKFEGINTGFKNMAQNAGWSTQALEKMREATAGTADDMMLMEKANNAMMLGVAESDDAMAELMNTAMRLGESLGLDTETALDSLVTGMGRQSKLMLDNLGIMVDTNKAYEVYADELGISSKALTDAQKKQAFNNATMKEASRLVEELGPDTETAGRALKRMGADTMNLAVSFGKFLAPGIERVSEGYGSMTESMGEAFNLLSKVDWAESFKGLGVNLSEVAKNVFQTLVLAFSSVGKYLWNDLGPDMWKFFKNFFTRLLEEAKKLGQYIWEPLKLFGIISALQIQKKYNSFFYSIRGLVQTYMVQPMAQATNQILKMVNATLNQMNKLLTYMGKQTFEPVKLIDVESLHTAEEDLKAAQEPLDKLIAHFRKQLSETEFMKDMFEAVADDTKTFREQLAEIWSDTDDVIKIKIDDDGTISLVKEELENIDNRNWFQKIRDWWKGMTGDTKPEEWGRAWNNTFTEINNTVGALGDMWGQQADSAQSAMEEQIQLSNDAYSAEKELIEASMESGEEKTERLAKLEQDRVDAEQRIRDAEEGKIRDLRRTKAQAEIAQAIISGGHAIVTGWANPFPLNIAIAGLIAAQTGIQIGMMKSEMAKLQHGGEFIADRPTPIMVGEAGQAERVRVTPLSATNRNIGSGGGQTNISINVSGNVLTRDFVKDELVEELQNAVRRGLIYAESNNNTTTKLYFDG